MPNHIPIFEETATYDVVELDQPEPETSFTFKLPADNKLVEKFPDPFHRSARPQPRVYSENPRPELTFKGADGKVITLSSLPASQSFWNSGRLGVGPCVDMIPELKQLYMETEGKGLVWITVDSDEDPKTAVQFLSREHAPSLNFHDEDGSLGKLANGRGFRWES